MASTGILNTRYFKIQSAAFAGTPAAITCQTNADVSVTNDTRDATCKDSGQWKEMEYAQTGWSMSGDALASEDGSNSYGALATLALAQTKVAVVIGTGVSGDIKLSGTALITEWSVSSSGTNENVQVKYSFQGTGALTKGTFA